MPIDYRDYPPTWLTHIRPRIMARAGEVRDDAGHIEQHARCEWCQVQNHDPHPQKGYRVVLTIAHLDHDKENWEVADERLAALCQGCHLSYDRPRHAQNKKYGRNWKRAQLKMDL